jgi:uncharacterized membrane protein
MKSLFGCILLVVPFGIFYGQEARLPPDFALAPRVVDVRAPELDLDLRPTFSARTLTSRFNAKPVLWGAVIGAAIGAAVGHEIGGPQSCPTSPGYSCGQGAIGTAGGAAIGMAVGAAIGAIIGMRQSADSQIALIPMGRANAAGTGVRYSRRF